MGFYVNENPKAHRQWFWFKTFFKTGHVFRTTDWESRGSNYKASELFTASKIYSMEFEIFWMKIAIVLILSI